MLEKKVTKYIKDHNLLHVGEKLLVGVSGGPDSLALLHFLHSMSGQYGLGLVAAHVDHMFRGEESYEDLVFVKKYCEERSIVFEGTRVNVNRYMSETGQSSQTAARTLRYRFYQEMMVKHSIHKLVLGHHGDDQMETILMRLTRGASGAARAGIPVKRPFGNGEIVRPFLPLEKRDILEYCSRQGLEPRLDPSNEKESYSRNRFRLSVLPFLKRENIKAHEHFQRFSKEIREDEELLLELTKSKMESIWVKQSKLESAIHVKGLMAMPNSLQRRAVQLILNYLYGENPESLSAKHTSQLMELFVNPDPSAELHFPKGLLVKKSYEVCMFSFLQTKPKTYYLKLEVPGEILLPNGYKIKAEYSKGSACKNDNSTFLMPAREARMPFIARTREEGDRMYPKGLRGSKKIKDIFINEKIPIEKRDAWPIVVDSSGEILWVPSLRKSSREAERGDDQQIYIYLEYIKV
ncbi:tRNA lysidine(34) synthetase TilS [Peribacillus deserti]|uniref:tRNA(Ile)-lysidine synthase n=1 Tax=Peribacillus deserti TaxID=673318 RepID=A0A2N5M921_9BACI|nr:tRNA lysidine(34) synthetase TilS [Peribacillus deserti]PLT30842.1 tRNA lysidine(34) synthetase TilS [Peribacillus deserti]